MGMSATLLVIWSFPYICLPVTFLQVVRSVSTWGPLQVKHTLDVANTDARRMSRFQLASVTVLLLLVFVELASGAFILI